MPNLHDIAKRAGVAPITVSRVINNSGYVSQPTRERVEAAVKELGYVPNTIARGLRSKRTHTLALIVTDITNPYFTSMARGVEDVAGASNYTVIYCNTDESEAKEEKYANMLAQRQVDGVLLVPSCGNAKTIKFLKSNDIDVVVLDRRISGVRCRYCVFRLGKWCKSFGKAADRFGTQTNCDHYRSAKMFPLRRIV